MAFAFIPRSAAEIQDAFTVFAWQGGAGVFPFVTSLAY